MPAVTIIVTNKKRNPFFTVASLGCRGYELGFERSRRFGLHNNFRALFQGETRKAAGEKRLRGQRGLNLMIPSPPGGKGVG
jgi:hypothetical protein